jgi:hypothetical protein
MRRLLLVLAIAGCHHHRSQPVGRIDFTDEGTKVAHTRMHGGHVDVWEQLDTDSADNFRALYELKLTDGANEWTQNCDPLDPAVTTQQQVSTHDGSIRVRFTGKMRCSFDVPNGTYDAQAKLILSRPRPASLTIAHMDVIFEQQ